MQVQVLRGLGGSNASRLPGETYVNVKGKWCYLYRAIDRDGNLVDSMVSEKRDLEAAKRFDLRKLSLWLVTPRSE